MTEEIERSRDLGRNAARRAIRLQMFYTGLWQAAVVLASGLLSRVGGFWVPWLGYLVVFGIAIWLTRRAEEALPVRVRTPNRTVLVAGGVAVTAAAAALLLIGGGEGPVAMAVLPAVVFAGWAGTGWWMSR
jgi:hypothetical protein